MAWEGSTPMLTLRELTPVEADAYFAATPPNADRLLHPPYRWHCARCGRFVPFAGVRRVYPPPWETDEHEHRGICRTHGEVYVSWGEQ